MKPNLAFLNSRRNELKDLDSIHETIWVVIRGFEHDFYEEYFKVEKFLKTKYVKYIEIIYGYYGDMYLLVSSRDKSTICNALKLDGVSFQDNRLVVNIP